MFARPAHQFQTPEILLCSHGHVKIGQVGQADVSCLTSKLNPGESTLTRFFKVHELLSIPCHLTRKTENETHLSLVLFLQIVRSQIIWEA